MKSRNSKDKKIGYITELYRKTVLYLLYFNYEKERKGYINKSPTGSFFTNHGVLLYVTYCRSYINRFTRI